MLMIVTRYSTYNILSTYQMSKELVIYFSSMLYFIISFYLHLISPYDTMTPRLIRFVATFTGNPRRMFSVIVCTVSPPSYNSTNETHGKERGDEIWTGMRLEWVI